MTTAGPAYSEAASPVITKMPAPTTLAMPSVVSENVPTAFESSRPRSVFACARMASRRSWWSIDRPFSPRRRPDTGDSPRMDEQQHERKDFVAAERDHRLGKLKELAERGI